MNYRTIILTLVLLGVLLLSACSPQRRDYLGRIGRLEDGGSAAMDEERIAELEAEIAAVVDQVETVVSSTEELGTFYRMLAVDFFDRSMFGPALDYIEKALYIYPENHVLYYYAGISQARIAKTRGTLEELTAGILNAERYYLEALRIRPEYRDALYALGVLYLFELDSPGEAVPYLERLARMDETRTDVRFVLARAYAALGETDEAAELYREIVAIDAAGTAAENARRLLDELGEAQ